MPFPAVHPALARALADQGYDEPTPVQAAVLEAEVAAADLLVSAQTGSGKTVAFGLAAASTLLGEAERFGHAGAPLALVIAPTRELAQQVSRELEWLYAPSGGRIVTCVGGMDPRREQRALQAGSHMVVGTPGRLKDHVERANLDLSAVRLVVLDEADEMLDMGFREDLEFILDACPGERRTLMFSATIAREIAGLAKRYQKDAVRIDAGGRNTPHGDIEYRALTIQPNEIEHAVVNVLRFFEAPGALVFCSTRESVRHLQASLLERRFSTVGLSGEMSQRERNDALQALRDGRARVCVATDVAARGLDLPDLGLVVHAELPVNRAALLHRSGRTGRAGRKGVSVLLVPRPRHRRAEALLSAAGVQATWGGAPTAEEIRTKDQQRLLAAPAFDDEASEEDRELARALLRDRSAEEVALALIRLRRADLPAPEELSPPGAPPFRRERPARGETGEAAPPWPGERLQPDEVDWYRLPLGRTKNADPKWLIPLICRLGGITKKEIGSIRVYPDETRFQIAKAVGERFRTAVAAAPPSEPRIEPSQAPAPGGYRSGPRADGEARPGRPPHKGPRPGWRASEHVQDRPAGGEASADAGTSRPAWTPRPEKPFRPGPSGKAGAKPGAKPFKAKPYGAKSGPSGKSFAKARGDKAPARPR